MNAQELSWAYLIREGCVYKDFCYWSGNYKEMPVKTTQCLEDIREHGINWKKSGEPSDGCQSEFVDTFSEPAHISTLEGTLVSNSGKKYKWGCLFNEPRNVFEIMAEFHKITSIDEIAAERLNDTQ